MRRWEKEVLKTIRAEAANSLRTPGTSTGGREPELTRALYQLSAEHGCAGESPAPRSTAGKRLYGRGREDRAALTAAQEGGQRVARAQDQPAARARQSSGDVKDQPATMIDGGGEENLEQPGPAPERSGETGMVSAGEAGGAAVASDISEDEGQGGEESQRHDAVKRMAEKLLRTSSSVALAVARPLSVKPPPVLEVEEDPRQVTNIVHVRDQTYWLSQNECEGPANVPLVSEMCGLSG